MPADRREKKKKKRKEKQKARSQKAPSPAWTPVGTTTCQTCHQSQGVNQVSYTGPHQAHTDNGLYRTACEACHANRSTRGNVVHTSGDNDVATGAYADVVFSDNGSSQVYGPQSYYGTNL